MKKILTIVSVFMSMLFGGIFLVSCSNGYDKMYLVVEYALPTEDGQDVEWKKIESSGEFDYILSNDVYSQTESAYVLYLRVKVKGASKKVKSLYISQSVNNSTILESNTVKPDEAFKVLVKNIGSVKFDITPSNGGEDKSTSFGVNIYKELTNIEQNSNCVPAVVTGGYIVLENLTNLINYYPLNETNQTGVNYVIEGIGTLINNGGNDLLNRTFVDSLDYNSSSDLRFERIDNDGDYVELNHSRGNLMLNVSPTYSLTGGNNVIKLRATSKYHEDINTIIYVYIVENFTASSLLVSYNPDVELDTLGNLPTQVEISQPVADNVVIYNSTIDGSVVDSQYNSIDIYTYTNASIYSYETNPGINLSVYVNGVFYNYNDVANNNFGIEISPLVKEENGNDKLVGLKFSVNPNSASSTNEYNIRLELDFTAFDFSASDKTPVSVLNREFTISVESLASGLHINGKGYEDNLDNLANNEVGTITSYNSTELAKLYTSYTQTAIGMPLNIQATPTNAVDTNVYVSFYESYRFETGELKLENNLSNKIQLLESVGFGLTSINGEFTIDFTNKNKVVYLRFNEGEDVSSLRQVYMVCKVACTPDVFGLEQIEKKYITFVAKIDVVGAIDTVYLYKNPSDNVDDDTLTDTYLANNTINTAYINLNSTSNIVDLSEINIASLNGKIKFSADGVNWVDTLTAEDLETATGSNYKIIYFRTLQECSDEIVIWSNNGIRNRHEYQFVNTTTSADGVSVEFDDTYIWESSINDRIGITDITKEENIELKYLALQSGRTAQFKALGDGRNSNIKAVTAKSLLLSSAEYSRITKNGNSLYNKAISTFSASAIRVSNAGSYMFDVRANSVGFTSILLVKVDFYVNTIDADGIAGTIDDSFKQIAERSKYFIYEIAVYTPAKDLEVLTDKNEIVYINNNYLTSANIDFEIDLNAATSRIQFSSTQVNESINLSYGESGVEAIYGMSVRTSENMNLVDDGGNPYFKIDGLNEYTYTLNDKIINENFLNSTRKFSIQALQSLQALQDAGHTSIYVDIIIYQFGVETIHQIRKVIYFGDHTLVEGIVVEGVDNYNNVYLSLLTQEASTTTIYASVSNEDATYKDIGYKLYLLDSSSSENNLSIEHNVDDGSFKITANNKGGIYQLELYSKDSYDSEIKDYKVKFNIRITVSDGQSEATAYLITSLKEFEAIVGNTETLNSYYRLAKDIDISALSKENWWSKDRRIFEGCLDGAITINDPNTGKTIYKNYSLIGLRINSHNTINDATCFGLFTSVSGTIKNVVFDRVVFEVELDSSNTSNVPVNIGAITAINNGIIENCSVNIVSSIIHIKTNKEDANEDASNTTYNIGLLVGVNNDTITYNNLSVGSNYAYMTDCYAGGILKVTVDAGNTKFDASTNINVGGIIGINNTGATISSTYKDNSDESIRTLITAVVNVELEVKYDASNAPMQVNNSVGGIAGLNLGTIKNVAVSGMLKANDKVNLGGIVGSNRGSIKECANYGAYIEGYALIENYTYTSAGSETKSIVYHSYNDANITINQEQNIGGIIGFNDAGIVDNVKTMFILFDSSDVSVEAVRSGLVGLGNIGGIIGKAVETDLTCGYVENFVVDGENELDYNIIGNNANVAGLIALSTNSSASLSFVQADFNVGLSNFYEFGKGLTYNYVYFIGDVLADSSCITDNHELKAHNSDTTNSYIVNNVVYIDASENIAKNEVAYGLSDIESIINTENSSAVDGYTIAWRKTETINNDYPYLVYIVDGEDINTLTIRPSEIIVNVDENYFDEDADMSESACFERYENGLYIQYNNNGEIRATAVVYYIENGNNTHKLVSDDNQKGLIEKTILPSIATGTYSVSIIAGAQIASLTDGDKTITFYGVGKVELRFVSTFDNQVQDVVVIFVENPLHRDTFDITTKTGLTDRTGEGERFTTQVGATSVLSLSMKSIDTQVFDSSKLYMNATVGTATTIINNQDVEIDSEKLNEYFTFKPITAKLAENKYSFGQFEMTALGIDKTWSYMEIPVTISVYLNFDKYMLEGVALSTLMVDVQGLIEERTITIIVYNKATNLTVSGDVKAESGVGVNIIAELTTGYINSNNLSGVVSYVVSGEKGDKLLLDIPSQDKINATLTAVNDNANDLLENAKNSVQNPQAFNIWDLFEVVVSYKLIENKGYTYNINLRLKTQYRYLDLSGYTDREWKFELEIEANSNNELSSVVEISFMPQQLTSFRLENYSNLTAWAGENAGTTEAEFVSNEVESSLIIPGRSGLIKIFAEYDYSYFENISITSTRATINNNEYFIRYQQMVYNKDTKTYQSYAGITADGETLNLKKVSYIENGEYSYDGVIFVRTILDEIVGVRQTFTMTVNATTYDYNGNTINVSRTKTVISQYLPGVYINVTNAVSSSHDNKPVYLLEQNSSMTNIVARVYGYEFNVQPTATISALNIGDTILNGEVALIKKGDVYKDNTGAYIITYALAVYTDKPFKVSMKMSLLDEGNTLVESSEELTFYPVRYIVNDVHLRGEANGGLNIAIGSSKDIELVWNTKVTTNEKISLINEKIKELDYLKLFHIKATDNNGRDYNRYFDEFLNSTNTSFSIKQNKDNTYRIEALMEVAPITVYFNLYYDYQFNTDNDGNTTIEVLFSHENINNKMEILHHEFVLNLTMKTTEDAPEPINTAEDLRAMSEGENYILMNDITLENWIPLNTAIASLDGNGKVINIKSFNITVENEVNVGLFSTISESTIIKNVIINIGTMDNNLGTNQTALYVRNENVSNISVNFGLLAGINNGLIYNCEVVSIGNSRTLEVVIGSTYSLTFGVLVGNNKGNITNSRVGTEYFERLIESDGNVSSVIVSCGSLYFRSKGIMAGFVGQNDANCIISSCYVANTSVENTSNIGDSERNRTAGFVATNNGLVAYSYVKGLERSIVETKARATGAGIYASGAGSVAGFAYLNSGEIHDCYSNIICKSNSSGVAGFVYNTLNGVVYQCYSASTVQSGSTNTALATELPFVGVGIEKDEAKKLLSNDKMVNCYYLNDGTEYDTNYDLVDGAVEPKALSLESFANSSSLNNYSFINDANGEQQLNGVWTYSTAVDKNKSTYGLGVTSLPELTSANKISRSLRVYDNLTNDSEEKSYKYPVGFEPGSSKNPYIIRSVEEYKSVFVESAPIKGTKYQTGYTRFIDNISFRVDGEYVNIDTRSNYVLGDRNNNTFTLIDGNGMTISNVVINYADEDSGNLGLFSEVYYSVIKALNIEYSSQGTTDGSDVGSSTVTYAGGVAGIARNTYMIDINLSGAVTLRAHNVVGGVVGRLTGPSSGLFNITTNLNVQAGNYSNSNRYVNEQSESRYLSYAGGIAGIIDIGSEDDSSYILNKLTVSSSNVRANRAGGIAGFLGENINAKRLTYVISGNSQVFGREVAGGIVADNFANIELSQANRDIDEQYNYDKAFAQYINDEALFELNNEAVEDGGERYGNLSAVTGEQIVGGFIGVNYAGDVTNSLTKANIGYNEDYGIAKTIGGFIGKTYGGDLKYVYAQNYIDLIRTVKDIDGNDKEYYAELVGGLVGHIANENSINMNLNNKSSSFGLDNVVLANWFDKSQVENLKVEQKVEYIAGAIDNNIAICKSTDGEKTSNPIISYGVFNADENDKTIYSGGKIKNSHTSDIHLKDAEVYSMEDLYYVPTGDDGTAISTQQDIFATLFTVWSFDYWEKDYTKFMPNLKEDSAIDYIKIETEEDIQLMEQFPNGNFILLKDIYLNDKYSNYIVNTEFKGILIGTLKEDKTYTGFYNITLNASTDNDMGAGFFKQTTGTRISNINFEYNQIQLNGSEYVRVGGVSAYDTDSRFEQIELRQGNKNNVSIISRNGASVVNLGSIVGESYRSKIISCSSDLIYNVNSYNINDDNPNTGNIGGLVGIMNGYYYDAEENIDRYDGLIRSSTYLGEIRVNSDEGVTIGGIVANAQYIRINDSSTEITTINNEVKTTESVKIYISSANTNYIGGIIGNSNMCSISNCSTYIEVLDNEAENINQQSTSTYYVGGIVGQIANQSTMDKDVDDSHSKLVFNLGNVENAFVGGIVGSIDSNGGINLKNLVSELIIPTSNDDASAGDVVDNMIVGGIIAITNGTPSNNVYGVTIESNVAILNCDVEYNSMLLGGGIIGQATGSYSINNSNSIGQLFANNTNNTNPTLTILGGFVGLADTLNGQTPEGKRIIQNINNSYTVLTMSTAGVFKGDVELNNGTNVISHNVYTNSIVGYTDNDNQVLGKGVVYSSDYTLTFERDNTPVQANLNKFENEPLNVTANVLVFNETTLKPNPSVETSEDMLYGYIGSSWYFEDGYLPMPEAVQEQLLSVGILSYNDSFDIEYNNANIGSAFNPIIYTDAISFNNVDKYTYYLVVEDMKITNTKGDLNGVLLGSNFKVVSSDVLFDTMDKHSAVSNLTFELNSAFNSNASVADTNNGTVFMVGVQYEDEFTVLNGFGGIVSVNNGVISNCYNMGNVKSNGNVGGLVYQNTINASIEDSYFSGSFSGGENGSAIAYNNSGYIYDCYSAGMAETFIGNLKNSLGVARYKNLYFDYYANYITIAEYENLEQYGIVGMSTLEMQAVNYQDGQKTDESKVLNGWKVYSMHNLYDLMASDITVNITYNYGYPIHNIEQVTLSEGKIIPLPIRVKATGNGTFEAIVDASDNYITDIDYLNKNVKGKLVSTTYNDEEKGNITVYYDNSSFLINNIGVLNLINSIVDTNNKYFELEVDIVLPDDTAGYKEDANTLLSNWLGIGSSTNPFVGTFTTSSMADSYVLNRTLLDEKQDENGINFKHDARIVENEQSKTIANLCGNALFAYVENGAVIANIVLKNSKVNNAPLINNVGSTSVDYEAQSELVPTILNIKIEESVVTNNTGNVAGLVNIINQGDTLNVHSVEYGEIEIVAYNENNGKQASSVAGVINVNNGTMNVKNSFAELNITMVNATTTAVSGFINQNGSDEATSTNTKINLIDPVSITLNSKEDNEQSINGFVAQNLGTIVTLEENSTIKIEELGKVSASIAGVVGMMKGGQIAGFEVEFVNKDEDSYQAEVFGGVAVYLNGGQLGSRAEEDNQATADRPIVATLTTATANTYGGIVAISGKDDSPILNNVGSIANVEIKSTEQISVKPHVESSNNAYGLVVGKYETALSEINYTIQDEITFKVDKGLNVGAIVGLATSGTFNFTNDMPKIVKVYGKENVGGLIGQYVGESSLIIEGNTWAVDDESEEGFAQIELFIPKAPESNIVEMKSSNFGGLIGYWNSVAELKCESKDENGETTPVLLTNKNNVLSFEDVKGIPDFNWFKNTEKADGDYDYILSNIGGIVGKSNASVYNSKNNAMIGVEFVGVSSHEGKNPINGVDINGVEFESTINEIMQFVYIGGIVGYISGDEIEVVDCVNNSNIYGMYAVGGLVGGSPNGIAISFTDNELLESQYLEGVVLGLSDVGGLMGKAQSFTFNASDETEISFDQIIGITNVGGVVGYATSVNINNCIIRNANEVMGNLNIGGIVGYASSGTIKNSEINGLDVVGTIFDYKYVMFNDKIQEDELTAFYYLPTNIGGITGYMAGESKFSKVIASVNVYTDTIYKIEGGNTCTVNMIRNYLPNFDGISDKTSISIENGKQYITYLEDYYDVKAVDYEAVDGGIGGFAGRLDTPDFATIVESGQTESTSTIYSECVYEGNVFANYGINVGGLVGYLSMDKAIKLPQLPTNATNAVNVAGKLFVGGYIGKCNGISVGESKFFYDGTSGANPVGYVNVQQYIDTTNTRETKVLTGNAIGGVIGYSTGEVHNIKLIGSEAKIKVFNSNQTNLDSSYIGVLVGRLDSNMSDCEVSATLCDVESSGYYDYDYSSVEGIIQVPTVYNYGGLVGLLSVPKGSKGENAISVSGRHYYPFTVDIVENRDYVQGQSSYTYEDNGLVANAHYINQSDIKISVSALDGLYNGVNDTNPVNENARGWAKDYTMFRSMARVIEQPDEPTGDSVQVIYSADYITEVATSYKKEANKDISDAIIYTIYQPLGQTARLYSKYGIAEQTSAVDTSWTEEYDVNGNDKEDIYELNYEVKIQNNQWIGSNNTVGRKAFWSNIVGAEYLGVTIKNNSYQWDDDRQGVIDNANKYQYTFGYSYYISNNYLNAGKSYFVFTTVYGTVNNEDTTLYSNSGSIFEVAGTVYYPDVDELKDKYGWIKWAAGVAAILIVAAVVVFVPGVKGLVIAFANNIIYALAGAGHMIAGSTILSVLGTVLAAGATGLAYKAQEEYYSKAQTNYTSIEDSSMGYLGSTYARNIKWKNGQLIAEVDANETIVVTVDLTMDVGVYNQNINALYQSGYDSVLVGGMEIDVANRTAKLPLTYFNCSTARAVPVNINQDLVEVEVKTMEEGKMKEILENLGVTSFKAPRFRMKNNELFVYSYDMVTERILYPNYEHVISKLGEDGFPNDPDIVVNEGGYAYILENELNYGYIILPDADGKVDNDLKEYGLTRTIRRWVNHRIDINPIGATSQVDLDELRWEAIVGFDEVVDNNQLVFDGISFKYAGASQPAGYSIDISAKLYNEIYYYRDSSGNYVNVDGSGEVLAESSMGVNTIVYFTLNGNGSSSASIDVVLKPRDGGFGLTANELTSIGINLNNTYYYIYDKLGDFDLYCNFALSHLHAFDVREDSYYIYNTSGRAVYDEVDMKTVLSNIPVTLYPYKGSSYDGQTVEDFFGEAVKTNMWEVYQSDISGGELHTYSLSNILYNPISDIYEINANSELVMKNLDTRYLVDHRTYTMEDGSISKIAYIYTPIYGSVEMSANFDNKYVYNCEVTDGMVKLYTRYVYDGVNSLSTGGSEAILFLSHRFNGEYGQTIKDLLLPNYAQWSGNKVTFAESVRVSLSTAGHRIYTNYRSGKYMIMSCGSIIALSSPV